MNQEERDKLRKLTDEFDELQDKLKTHRNKIRDIDECQYP